MNNQKSSRLHLLERECKINSSKNTIHVFAAITEEECNPKAKPPLPTIKDTVQILSKTSVKPSIPTINETVLLRKCNNQLSNKSPKEVISKDLKNQNKLFVNHKSDKNNKINETRLFIEQKKKERTDKQKMDLLAKKKIAEERKKKLDQLQKTTRELAKASIKKKVIHVQDDCKISLNLSTESNPKVDLKWLPSHQVKSLKKTSLNQQKKLFKNVETSYHDNECLNDTKNMENSISISSTISKHEQLIPQMTLTEPKYQNRNVTKPENLFSNFKINENHQLINTKIFEISAPKLIDFDTSVALLNSNDVQYVKDKCYDNEIQKKKNSSLLEMEISNNSIKPLDLEKEAVTEDLQLNQLHDELLKSNDSSNDLQESLIKSINNNSSYSLSKRYCSESTQTNNYEYNLSSLLSLKTPIPPMNFISVLKCKDKLQQIERKNQKLFSIPIHSFDNAIDNTSNVEFTMFNKPCIVDSNEIVNIPNLINNAKDSFLNKFQPIDESKSNNLFFNETTENTISKETDFVNNEILTEITNEDVKQILKKLNYDLNVLTENSSNTNNLQKKSIKLKDDENNSILSSFPKIHDGFQAELNTLDQLNDSLCDIENMSSNLSINTKEQSIDDEELENNSSNDLNLKTLLKNSYAKNNVPSLFSKLNGVSFNNTSIDKTITGFSIQMFEQLIRDEELRAKQHSTILLLREKSLINRLKWEITLCELQVKNFKNRPGYEKQLQLFKQKQRGRVKKLEHSLSQVKRLGRVLDSVYKQRLIMLEEHLQHLRMQSSSKKIIRKLKSLDQSPKKEESTCCLLSSHILKQCEKTVSINIDSKCHDNINIDEFNMVMQHDKISPIASGLNESNNNLCNQATPPINIETNFFKRFENVEVQTDIDWSLLTSKKNCSSIKNDNIKSFVPIDLHCKNKLSDINVTKNDKILSPIVDLSSVNLKKSLSETSLSTNSELSEFNVRITDLQGQLESRKLESFKLKKEQKKLKLENLKAKEQDLLKQIELYDKKIEESRKSLIIELEKKSTLVKKSSLKYDYSSKNSLQSLINSENNHTLGKNCKHLQLSDKINWVDSKEYVNTVAIKRSNNCDQPINESLQQSSLKFKENINSCTNSIINPCNSAIADSQLFENSKVNQVTEVEQLQKKTTFPRIINVKETCEVQTEVNNTILRSVFVETPVIMLSNPEKHFKKENITEKKAEVDDADIENACKYTQNQVIQTSANYKEELFLIKNKKTEKSPIFHNILNSSYSSSSSSYSVLNENDSNIYDNKENTVNKLNVLNNEIQLDDDYSPDFTSDENTSEFKKSYEFNQHNVNKVELYDREESNESSYEEDRSEGYVIYEDKSFIEKDSNDCDEVQNVQSINADKVNVISDNIFNCLLKDAIKVLKSNIIKPLFILEKNELNNVTEETPLLMILKREKEHQNTVFLSKQVMNISDILFKRHLHTILFETLQMYLPKLNEVELERLNLYLKWSSKRKKLKLSENLNFQLNIDDVDNNESFEYFYQKHQEQNILVCQNENNGIILSQTQNEAEKLKLEQMRIEEEIERLRMVEEPQFFLREIPNKPPPPYKSPTKKKGLVDIPYTSDEIHKIIVIAASQLYNNHQNTISNDFIEKSDSNLHVDYKTLIFDYCKEIAQDEFIDEQNVPIWERTMKKLKHFRARPKNTKDLSDVVIKKINQIIDIDECEEKVNKFVVKQMHEEDSKWIDFQMDEVDIQNDIVQSLMKKLICDTVSSVKTSFYLKFI